MKLACEAGVTTVAVDKDNKTFPAAATGVPCRPKVNLPSIYDWQEKR